MTETSDAGTKAATWRVALQRAVAGPLLELGSLGQWTRGRLIGAPRPLARFVIFGRGRSGSTLLVSTLSAHPEIACAGEVLRYRTLRPAAHLRRVLGSSGAQVSGAKLLSYQLRSIHGLPPQTDFLRRLADDGVIILYLTRDNPVRHAISNIYARKRRVYHVAKVRESDRPQDRPQGRPQIEVSPTDVLAWTAGSAALAAYETEVLRDVAHVALSYERDLRDAVPRAATLARLVAMFGLSPAALSAPLAKVTPEDLRLILRNHDALMAGLAGTDLAPWLPGAPRDV